MPINFPRFQEIAERTRADVATQLPGVDPTLPNSFIRIFVDSQSSRAADVYADLARLLREAFPQTASGEFLDFFGEITKGINGVPRIQATRASGIVNMPGVAGAAIPVGTAFASPDGITYTSTASANVNSVSIQAQSLTRVGNTATALFAAAHGLASGQSVTISGATQTEYNGAFVITVIDESRFSYTVSGAPASPATGTILAASSYAAVSVLADDFGLAGNKESGALIGIASVISGVDSQGFVPFAGLSGGGDLESDDRYRERIIQARARFDALFDSAQIISLARSVQGVSRVKVNQITPSPGQVTVLFVKDDDAVSIIPSPGDVQAVKAALLAIKPAHVADEDVIVLAPTPVTVNFNFTALSPDTPELRAAIRSNLAALFSENIGIEASLAQDKYRGVIATTIDPLSGASIDSFTLSAPVGDIVIASGQIAVLGGVTFA